MRAFIVVCLLALASAQRSGYDYHLGGGGDGTGAGVNFGSIGSGSSQEPSVVAPGGGEIQKEFYTFTAEEDDVEEPAASNQYSDSLKQNVRVIFIKAPENKGLENAAISLAKQASEQRTAIYVLAKQTNYNDLANKLNAERNDHIARPEVHFVKYRTPEDAAHAQHTIQSQYDSLGGTSQNIDGGVAPTINFASHAPAGVHSGHAALGSHRGLGVLGGSTGFINRGNVGQEYIAPGTNYLPPSLRRRFRL